MAVRNPGQEQVTSRAFFFRHVTRLAGPQFSDQGSNPGPVQWKCTVWPLDCWEIPRTGLWKSATRMCPKFRQLVSVLQPSLFGWGDPKAWADTRECYLAHPFWDTFLLCAYPQGCEHRQLWKREDRLSKFSRSCSRLKHSHTDRIVVVSVCLSFALKMTQEVISHFPLQQLSPAAVCPPGEPCSVQHGAHERQQWSHGTDEHELHAHGWHAHGSWAGTGFCSFPFFNIFPPVLWREPKPEL